MNFKAVVSRMGAMLLGLLALAWVNQAKAVGSANASIGNIAFALVDLAPDDGLAPQLTYSGGSLSSGWLDPLNGDPTRPNPDPRQSYFQPGGSAPNSFGASHGTLSVPGMSSFSETASSSISATALTSLGQAVAQAQVYSQLDPQTGIGFALSPHSAFTISAQASVQASSDGASFGNFYWQFSESSADAQLSIAGADGSVALEGRDSLRVDTGIGAASLQSSRLLTATFSNPSDQIAYGIFYIYADAISTSAVPEPGTSALLLAGGLLLMLCLRGRTGASKTCAGSISA